ncbi:Endopolyphosphatase [Sparassis crispa]|uniref:Endopolyphosphatase n=1 Tax=Sparassis crispa TaxID=139825 RepID=A0A401GBE5_9APHY|nr:Endopolyphosphatase [Sparassis crispa]GBE79453.1 Endopolyphosphatase [Sparassis crispa]
MLEFKLLSLLLLTCLPDGFAAPVQVPLQVPATRQRRKLQGRFLHITDMHPDGHFQVDASEKSSCHRKKPRKAKRRSGYFGMPFSNCDAPFTLTNYTLDFLDKEWSSEIDFVVWTGDSARHDNDRKIPRTTAEIYGLNRAITKRMEEVFTSKGIPVVPSIGNNDVWPHNIMMPGPNSITFEFSSIWRSFMPFESYQVFQRGGYYSVEVIPDSLAVISLNTMYFYDSNKAVGGCEYTDPEDPGNLQFDWLEVQLDIFRRRGMQVWLTGHVPPSSNNFFPDCYVRYAELSLRYQDTILGHLYGHMNADHFFFMDAETISSTSVPSLTDDPDEIDTLGRKKELYDTLIRTFADLPKGTKNISYDDYGVVNVSPSVVPNPYLPSFRIFTYNITGSQYVPKAQDEEEGTLQASNSISLAGRAASCNDSMHRNTWRCQLTQPWHSNPHSPSRSNNLWSPLGFAQYYLPDLEFGTAKRPPKYKLEYLTYQIAQLHPPEKKAGLKPYYPIPLRHLPKSLRDPNRTESKFAPYELADLTIPSWTELAQRLGEQGEKKLRRRFRRYMFMGSVKA